MARLADVSDHADQAVNVVLTFRDQDGQQWLAAAVMAPLQRAGTQETCPVEKMPDRVFALAGFRIVTS